MKNDQKRYEYKVFPQLTIQGSDGEKDLSRMDIERFRIGLKEAFGDRFKWLKHGSIYKDYAAFVATVDGIGEDEKKLGADAKIVFDLILEKLGHIGWKHMDFSIQPKREDGNLWFSFRKEVVLEQNNQI